MRESNFAFPAQNRACVCISPQLYDRRALDTNSPLPLLTSLTHLNYLTSTSPRIREILTQDGGLERLVRLLRDFCFAPPPPENPTAIYGLSPPSVSRPPPVPVLNPKNFDRHAAYRFSLALQCVVNIGVRGSEPIRSRVVQAGTLDVVGCILEAWLASKGFAVGPSSSASGLPRETREQRMLRRQQIAEQQRQREAQVMELTRVQAQPRAAVQQEDEEIEMSNSVATSDAETTMSTDTSANATPLGSSTPTGTVVVPGRERSGTVLGRTQWDSETRTNQQPQPRTQAQQAQPRTTPVQSRGISRNRTIRAGRAEASTPSTSTSRPETETEDDGEQEMDADVEMSQDGETDENAPPTARTRPHPNRHTHARRTVGIVDDSPLTTAEGGQQPSDSIVDTDMDARIVINAAMVDEAGMGVEDGIVSLDQNVNDDLAMGAPPGAPGAIDDTPRTRARNVGATLNIPTDRRGGAGGNAHGGAREDLTPRAVLASLPANAHGQIPIATPNDTDQSGEDVTMIRDVPVDVGVPDEILNSNVPIQTPPAEAQRQTAAGTGIGNTPGQRHHHHHHRHHHVMEETGPFREEDVLLSLQLLAYLSKYPHIRQAFYKQRLSFHPATVATMANLGAAARTPVFVTSGSHHPEASSSRAGPSGTHTFSDAVKKENFFKSLTGRGKDKAPAQPHSFIPGHASIWAPATVGPTTSLTPAPVPVPQPRMTNVFSLVERFTFRPSPSEYALPNPPPLLPLEIQYWAGVIMRNACRKDENQGGIRQCANMLCGKWERYPRQFAKCRRCRKAKYCSKECQSRAWSEGHRFWCSAREEYEGNAGSGSTPAQSGTAVHSGTAAGAHTQANAFAQNPNRTQAQANPERLAAALANVANARNNQGGGGGGDALADAAARIERRLERIRMEEIRGNPNAAAAGSRSPTSPVLNAREMANSILAETIQRIGVQNIVIGSRTGIPDAARGSADSAMTHLAASREQHMDQARSSTSSPMSIPETNADTAVNQTPRASLANMPPNSNASTTFTITGDTSSASIEAFLGEVMNDPSLSRLVQQQQQPRVGVARRRAGTVSSIQNSPTTAIAGSYPWSNTPIAQSHSGEASTTASTGMTRGHVIRSPIPIDRSETIRAVPAPPVATSVEANPRTRDAEIDDGSDDGDDMVIG